MQCSARHFSKWDDYWGFIWECDFFAWLFLCQSVNLQTKKSINLKIALDLSLRPVSIPVIDRGPVIDHFLCYPTDLSWDWSRKIKLMCKMPITASVLIVFQTIIMWRVWVTLMTGGRKFVNSVTSAGVLSWKDILISEIASEQTYMVYFSVNASHI